MILLLSSYHRLLANLGVKLMFCFVFLNWCFLTLQSVYSSYSKILLTWSFSERNDMPRTVGMKAYTYLKLWTDECFYILKWLTLECGALSSNLWSLPSGTLYSIQNIYRSHKTGNTPGVGSALSLKTKCTIWKENVLFWFLQGL